MSKNNISPKRRVTGIWIPIEVWKLRVKGMLPIHRCVLAEVDSLSGPDDPCRVGNQYLADFFGVSARTISRSINWLYDHKLITLWFDKPGQRGRRLMPRYKMPNIKIPKETKEQEMKEAVQGSPDQKGTNTAKNDHGQNVYPLRQNVHAPRQSVYDRKPLENPIEYPYNVLGKTKKIEEEVSSDFKNPEDVDSSIVNTSPQVPRRPPSFTKTKILFRDSPYAELSVLETALKGSEYELADLKFYHQLILNWSNGKGAKNLDWLGEVGNFILRDKRDGKSVYSSRHKSLNNENSIIDYAQAKRIAGTIRV